MFAEISAEGWGIIIAAIGTVIVQVVNAWRMGKGQDSLERGLKANTKETVETKHIAQSAADASQSTSTRLNGHMEEFAKAKEDKGYQLGLEHGRKEAALAIITAKEVEAKHEAEKVAAERGK